MGAAIYSEVLLTMNIMSSYLSKFQGFQWDWNWDLLSCRHVICYVETSRKKQITSIFRVEFTFTLKIEAPNSHEVINNYLPENTLW
jgi:hypothetical protein